MAILTDEKKNSKKSIIQEKLLEFGIDATVDRKCRSNRYLYTIKPQEGVKLSKTPVSKRSYPLRSLPQNIRIARPFRKDLVGIEIPTKTSDRLFKGSLRK